jgi:hypothetical protein
VLLGQDCRAPHAAVVDAYGAISGGVMRKPKISEENLFQCQVVHHESHLNLSGIEPEFPL